MRVLVVLSLFLATSFSGCFGGGDTMTAMDGLDEALEAAQNWSDDPQLVGVMSIEPFRRLFAEGEGEILVHLDSTQADGNSPAWVYLYQGIDRFIFVATAAKLGVLAEGWMSEDEWGESDGPIEGWSIDSDETADILAQEEDWPEPSEDMWTFWELTVWDGEPYWVVEAGNMTGEWEAVVHAGNGTVMDLDGGSYEDWGDFGHYSSGWDYDGNTGAVTSINGGFSVSVTLGGPGTIDVSTSGMVANGIITMEFLDPNGNVTWNRTRTSGPLFDITFTADAAEAGTYTLRVDPVGGLTVAEASLSLDAYW